MNSIWKLFDTQKEWIGWMVGVLTCYMGYKIINMPVPHSLHVQVFMLCLSTTVALVAAKLVPEITGILKGAPKQ